MYEYPDLIIARRDMATQEELYRPTVFWSEASLKINAELIEFGIENFRRLPISLSFFVPTYGPPGGNISSDEVLRLLDALEMASKEEKKSVLALKHFLSGKLAALADYRVLLAADNPNVKPYLHEFSESSIGSPVEQFDFDSKRFSRSSLNYLLGLALLKKHLNGEELKTILEIGGGFGTLGEIFNRSGIEGFKYIDIDIPPTSFIAQYYLSSIFGVEHVTGYVQTANLDAIQIQSLPKASVLCSWQIEKLQGTVDLFVNFISFQEMEPHIVKNYLHHVMRLGAKWILLRNMREGKQLRKNDWVGVDVPILTEDYLDMLPGYELIEKNILPFGYETVDGFHSELLLLKLRSF